MSKKTLFVIVLAGVAVVSALGLGVFLVGRSVSTGTVVQGQGPGGAGRPPGAADQADAGAPRGLQVAAGGGAQPEPGQPQARNQGQSPQGAAAEEPREIAPDKVRGKIVDTGWRIYVVRSQDTGKKYRFAYGRITKYNKRQRLGTGDRVTVTYEYDRKRLVATRIDIH